ncbi:hypothetical protein BT63DRAFT_324974 [Microthyrium microscopicum]|uniref:Large ribosomal subunit protein mL43 n=1 Tax=Microthyrium microscopicum TaxID=703497 RepID=A0A6A6U794_9PEZI|nr:hypothetical protein BT63DRAFT_324974 [Microthyrium microscopicum]
MVVRAIHAVSKPQNGVGAFVVQCKKLEFYYCDWAGSSKGMNSFIRHQLPLFAQRNPQVEMTVTPRPRRHPFVRASYVNGQAKVVCLRNLEKLQILDKVRLMKSDNGEKLKRVNKPVTSINDGVRGIFSHLHSNKLSIGLEGMELKKKKK